MWESKVLEKEKTRRYFDKMSPDLSVWSETQFASFEFCVREPSGPKSAKWAPLSLSAPCLLAGKTCTVSKGVRWRHLCNLWMRAARHLAAASANFFRAKFHHSALHYTHVPPSFRIAKMKFSFNFLLEIWLHTLMSIAITLHQIVLMILLYIRGHNFMVISDLITLHHIYATAYP